MKPRASAEPSLAGQSAPAAGDQALKHTQRFRRAANAVRLTPGQMRRQAGAMSAGWQALGSRDSMLNFFNMHSDELGGRPIDIAVDSDAGLELVITALSRIAENATQSALRSDR